MNLRKRQNIMVGALYTAFAYYWLVEMYYYMRWGCTLLRYHSLPALGLKGHWPRTIRPAQHRSVRRGPLRKSTRR